MVVTKKQHKFGSATEESVLPPKTNNKNCIGTMNFISVLPSLPLRIPSPPTRRAEKGHADALQTFSLWRWGGDGLAVRQNPHSFSLTTPEKDQVCHPAICNQYPRLHRQEAMENEGAMGLTHRSCFLGWQQRQRWQQRGAMICRIILGDLLFLKARRQGRREDIKWHGVHLLGERETRTTINVLEIVSEGGTTTT
jgi:hypothetical protein